MAIATNYPTPVSVNGFLCKNCTDVDYAKKHIDPAHPRSGPYGIDAKDDPTVRKSAADNAVVFGGSLGALNAGQASAQTDNSASAAGTRIDLTA